MNTGRRLDFPPDRATSESASKEGASRKPTNILRRAAQSPLFWAALVALATIGILAFYLYTDWRAQEKINQKELRDVNRLVDEALLEIDEDPDKIEIERQCRPPLDEERMRLERAKLKIDDARSLRPNHPRVLTALGIYRMKLCESSAAEEFLRQAIQQDKTNAKAHYCLGALMYQNNRDDAAVAEFVYAAEIDKEDPRPLVNLGILHLQRQQYGAALGPLSRASQLKPGSWEIRELVGITYIYEERWTEAILALREAADLSANAPTVLYHLGLACREAENHQEAVEHFEKALEVDPDFREVYPLLGDSLATINRKGDAKEILRDCVRRWPGFEACVDSLEEVSTGDGEAE